MAMKPTRRCQALVQRKLCFNRDWKIKIGVISEESGRPNEASTHLRPRSLHPEPGSLLPGSVPFGTLASLVQSNPGLLSKGGTSHSAEKSSLAPCGSLRILRPGLDPQAPAGESGEGMGPAPDRPSRSPSQARNEPLPPGFALSRRPALGFFSAAPRYRFSPRKAGGSSWPASNRQVPKPRSRPSRRTTCPRVRRPPVIRDLGWRRRLRISLRPRCLPSDLRRS